MSFRRPHALAPLVVTLALHAACGGEPHTDQAAENSDLVRATQGSGPTAADVKTWDGSATLQANKQAVVAAAKKLGASDELTRIFLAVGMIETNEMNACDRDTGKDNAGLAKNYSAFNINGDMLQRIGWSEAVGPDLNQQANVEAVVGLLIKAVNTFGLEGFLCFHRGGAAALADHCSYGAQDYKNGVMFVADFLKNNPQDMTSARRVALFLQHV